MYELHLGHLFVSMDLFDDCVERPVMHVLRLRSDPVAEPEVRTNTPAEFTGTPRGPIVHPAHAGWRR